MSDAALDSFRHLHNSLMIFMGVCAFTCGFIVRGLLHSWLESQERTRDHQG